MADAVDAEVASTQVRCKVSEGFAQWIARSGGSVAISTYQAGKVAMVGWTGDAVHVTMRDFARPMGMAFSGSRLAIATHNDLMILANAPLLAGEYLASGRYDALFLPRVSYHTGNLNLHDLAFVGDELWAVNTRFGCLATLSADFSFVPRWQPHFLSMLAPEDRCHLNGLAMSEGRPAFVTALGRTDTPRGWSATKATGGILMHVESNSIVLDGLCMPHSPRLHDGRLWLLNSGRGELWIVDPQRGDHTVVVSLPGYLRGLAFVGGFALIGMSRVREKHAFAGLPVQQAHERLICGAAVVDLKSGRCVGMLEFTEGAEELYDVLFIPGVRRPALLNLVREASRQGITAPEFSYWIQPAEREEEAQPSPPAAASARQVSS